ncbi:glycoside hydrolase family 15 protein [Risungbinella massiliensis]|uniref:glycoside hydrolase family 15 protein n=1 Tax=Risungbinella massiliensis TaxID=1329796 RepID=UPI0005CB9A50|nr:glycoside hydrolase family 15 protein [Risungbinella massiliensis]
MKADLVKKSIEIILTNQHSTGAYLASPCFQAYQHSWFRDGTFIAYSMNLLGQHHSAKRFYQWCQMTIERHRTKAEKAIQLGKNGSLQLGENYLHARYTVDGNEVPGHWGNFQLDGFGAYLWGLAQYLDQTRDYTILEKREPTLQLIVDYLIACWRIPNYDCWEENGDQLHPATFGAIQGGLQQIKKYLPSYQSKIERTCGEISSVIQEHGVMEGRFRKSLDSSSIDASLLWISTPFQVVREQDPLMRETVKQIEERLVHLQGVYRYPEDTYYGGGKWILLTAWLGWYYSRTGEKERANLLLQWIEEKYTEEGLPEQVQHNLLAPTYYDSWVQKHGSPAIPLIWSHAMYLVLWSQLHQNK